MTAPPTDAAGDDRAETADARRREAESRGGARAGGRGARARAETRATRAVDAANDALTRLLRACDVLEQRAAQMDGLVSRVAELERGAVVTPETLNVVPPMAPAAPPATEAAYEPTPARAPAPSDDHPAQRPREVAGGLRRLVTHKGGR